MQHSSIANLTFALNECWECYLLKSVLVLWNHLISWNRDKTYANQVTRVEDPVPDSCQANFDAGFRQAADYPVHHVLSLCNLKKGGDACIKSVLT